MKLTFPDELREFFRKKGKIGAAKRMKVLSAEQRREIARNAAQARWRKPHEKRRTKAQPKSTTGGKQK